MKLLDSHRSAINSPLLFSISRQPHSVSTPQCFCSIPTSNAIIKSLPKFGFFITISAAKFIVSKSKILHFPLSSTSTSTSMESEQKQVYSVWALPPEDVRERLKKLMEGLRSEFGGPEFEPHVTVVGAISLTESDAREMFHKACQGVQAYKATVERVATGTFFYQCVFLLLHPAPEVLEASSQCCGHFGYKASTPYMPHLSLLYGDLTEEEKKKAQEKVNTLDESISSLSFPISRLALYKTDTEDKTLKSWEKVVECNLDNK